MSASSRSGQIVAAAGAFAAAVLVACETLEGVEFVQLRNQAVRLQRLAEESMGELTSDQVRAQHELYVAGKEWEAEHGRR